MALVDCIYTCSGCGHRIRTSKPEGAPTPVRCLACKRVDDCAALCVRVASPHDVFTASDFAGAEPTSKESA